MKRPEKSVSFGEQSSGWGGCSDYAQSEKSSQPDTEKVRSAIFAFPALAFRQAGE